MFLKDSKFENDLDLTLDHHPLEKSKEDLTSKHKIKYLRRSNRLYLKINRQQHSEFSILMVKVVFTTEKI